MSFFHNILYGFMAGLGDILPVSSQAHTTLLKAMMGEDSVTPFTRLLVHIAVAAALYFSCHNQILRITRAVKLSRIPKRRRTRPLDTKSLMELSMLKNMAIPVIIGFFFYSRAAALGSNLIILAGILIVNGIILYVPQFLPGSNKDARSMSPVDSFLMGLGGAASVLPGISAVGAATSIGSICGAERTFALNMSLMMNILVTCGMVLMDILSIFSTGLGINGFLSFLSAVLAAGAAFGGVLLGIEILKRIAQKTGFGFFAYYSWGAALFSFVLYLTT